MTVPRPIYPRHHYVVIATAALAAGYLAIAIFRHSGPIQRLRRLGGDWTVFYKVAPTLLYLDYGLSVVKLGEEARVPLKHFSLDGRTASIFAACGGRW